MKNKIINITVVGLGILIMSGCSNKYPLTFASKPVNGNLICEGKNMGSTPKTLYYELTEENKKSGDLHIRKCIIKWSNNQTTEYSQHFDINKFPDGVMTTANSPHRYSVTFNTYPQGATLICNNKNIGYTPQKLSYLFNSNSYSSNIESCSANWASGYSENYPTSISTNTSKTNINLLLQRPKTDDYNIDADFELKVQNMKYQKRQSEAAEANARASRAVASAAQANARANKKATDDAFYQNLNRNQQLQNQNYQLQNINNYMRYGY
jgi:hypothetical protein